MWYVVLVEIHEESPASCRQVDGKGRSNIIVFLDNYGYSCSITYQDLTVGSYLKWSGNVDSETYL